MRILHTMLRVTNLEQSLAFYTNILGMRCLRRNDYPQGRFTLAFVGYQDEAQAACLELTYNWDCNHYEHGDAYGHIALAMTDIQQACADIEARGGKLIRPPGPMRHGNTVIAFIEDPDGYKIELIERD